MINDTIMALRCCQRRRVSLVIFLSSLRYFPKHKKGRQLLSKKPGSILSASVEVLLLDDFKLSISYHAFKALLVSLSHTILPHGHAHCGYEETTHFESRVNIFDCFVRHVARHPDTRCRHDVKLIFERVRVIICAPAQEEVVMLTVEASLTDGV